MCTWTEQIFERNIRLKFVVHSSELAETATWLFLRMPQLHGNVLPVMKWIENRSTCFATNKFCPVMSASDFLLESLIVSHFPPNESCIRSPAYVSRRYSGVRPNKVTFTTIHSKLASIGSGRPSPLQRQLSIVSCYLSSFTLERIVFQQSMRTTSSYRVYH